MTHPRDLPPLPTGELGVGLVTHLSGEHGLGFAIRCACGRSAEVGMTTTIGAQAQKSIANVLRLAAKANAARNN